ncbi:MAG TPA: uracil-DNA glycosylase [Acidimicrobiia bacterium]|nr:uracil-DNA glycosylase [Acidimicrobiia bacterium]
MNLADVHAGLIVCRRCPRLVEWRERVATEKRAAFRDEEYWGRPVPGFGDPRAAVAVVGLAPAAHGANRTGRMFTGDRSGEWLFRALHRTGFADRPTSVHRADGLRLEGLFVTSAVHCAPPGNAPTAEERDLCRPWTTAELRALPDLRVVVALGGLGYEAVLRMAESLGWQRPRPKPAFGHGVEVALGDGPVLLCSYHPSQQNTFTKRLTQEMLDAVFERARLLMTGEG